MKNNILAQLTDEEKEQLEAGAGLYLYIQAEDLTGNVPEADKAAMESVKGDNTIGMFMDLSLFLKVGDGKAEVIPTEYNSQTNKLTFETSGFSTFAIAYKDTAVTDKDTTVAAGTSPETGEAPIALPGLLMMLAAGLCVVSARKARG